LYFEKLNLKLRLTSSSEIDMAFNTWEGSLLALEQADPDAKANCCINGFKSHVSGNEILLVL